MPRRFSFAFSLTICAACLFAQGADDPAYKSQQAKQLLAQGRFGEAATIYAELVKLVPGNPGLLMNLGMAYFMGGNPRAAIPQLEAALKIEPNLPPASMFLGASYLRINQASKAVPHLTKAVAAMPEEKSARQMLAEASFGLKRYETAAEHYRKLAESDSSDTKAWHGLGRSYEALAERAFAELEKTAPESGYMLALVGEIRLRQNQYPSAFYLYRQALERQPGLRGIHSALAEIYKNTDHADWAAEAEKKERSLAPVDCAAKKLECDFAAGRLLPVAATASKTPEALYWRSRAYNELAMQAFSRLAALPPSIEIHELMADTHTARGRHRDAANEWRSALKLKPGDARIEKDLAQSLYLGRDYPAALPLLERLVEREPKSAHLTFLLGDTLLSMQQTDRAIPLLKKAVSLDPKLLPARATLGRALVLTNQQAEAIPHLTAALSVDQDGSIHFQLARAYQSTGQAELARQMMLKYQDKQKSTAAGGDMKEFAITPP